MYPYDIIFGLDLYDILLVLGFFGALLIFRHWADARKLPTKLQNLCIGGALGALVGGYMSAVLFQALYNFLDGEAFAITSSTGATFYGGLIGGVIVFLVIYFEGGYFLLGKGVATKHFFTLTEIAAASITFAHGIGRIGCLFAGCCYGQETTKWFGVYNVHLDAKTVPVQLLEAVFLLILFGWLTYRLHQNQRGNFGLYLILYGVWRFYIELFRADDRGQTFVSSLSPSQFMAIVLAVVGIGFWILDYVISRRASREEASSDAS